MQLARKLLLGHSSIKNISTTKEVKSSIKNISTTKEVKNQLKKPPESLNSQDIPDILSAIKYSDGTVLIR